VDLAEGVDVCLDRTRYDQVLSKNISADGGIDPSHQHAHGPDGTDEVAVKVEQPGKRSEPSKKKTIYKI
jgi:hypothetical protein